MNREISCEQVDIHRFGAQGKGLESREIQEFAFKFVMETKDMVSEKKHRRSQ